MHSIEVCLSPALFEYKITSDNYIVVIVDVLRATTAFCAAFDSGAKTIIPVSELSELLEYKNKGYITAGERGGKKVDFADFGNSPTVFLQRDLSGKAIAYSTTNGTYAVEMAKSSRNIVVAAFVNINAVSEWLIRYQKNVVILCSGWEYMLSMEDSLCAGAIVESLELSGEFAHICDASTVSLALWESSKSTLTDIVKKGNHYQRLLSMELYDDLQYCFRLNTSTAVPVWNGKEFVDLSITKEIK